MERAFADETVANEHPSWKQLSQFALGTLDADQTVWMEKHIAECETCCQQLESAPEDRLTHLLKQTSDAGSPSSLRLVAGYQILQELGRGGMGVVYRAIQPALNRQVAIKMIGQMAHASQQELIRFRIEAEASASLNHPNIAQVYDVGEMNGQPYIAMELVHGRTLAEHFRSGPLEFGEAANLVQSLAQAMQHAHASGIIHRDLKPSNILLEEDGASSSLAKMKPKIVDFGLAKRMNASTALTSVGNIVGTPSYMPPELAVGDNHQVGPTTDIYSLGAILYEALVGRPPFSGATALETLSQVKLDDPAKPRTLRSGLPSDLETICLKCLEKLPANRFQSADDLQEDLQRFLDGRPILAKPVSFGRRAVKWSKRHPTLVALIAVSLLASLGVVAMGVAYNASLRKALHSAENERLRANENFQISFQAVERVLDRVGFAQLADTPEMEDVREKLMADAVEFYSQLLERQPQADIQSRRQYYGAMSRLGRIQGTLGQKELGLKTLRDAIELQKHLSLANPDRYDLRQDTASSYINKGHLSNDASDFLNAIQILEDIADVYPDCRIDLAQALNNLAVITPSIEEREQLHLRASELRKSLIEKSPDDPRLQYGLAETQHNLAFLYMTTGRSQEAESFYSQALKRFEQLVSSQNSVTDYHRALAECITHMANMLQSSGRTDEAIELIQRGTATRRVLASRFPKLPAMREAVIRGLLTEAAFHIHESRFDAASQLSHQAVDLAAQLTQEFPTNEQRFVEASCLTILATALSGDADLTAARSAFERANKIYDELLTANPDDVHVQMEAGVQFMNYSNTLRAEQPLLAAEFNDRSVELLESIYEKLPQRTDIRSYLFNAHGARANSYDALNNHRESIVSWTRALELAPPERKFSIGLLQALALARGREIVLAKEAANVLVNSDNISGADLYNLACVFGLLHKCSQQIVNINSNEIPLDELDEFNESAIELLSRPAAIEFLRNANNRQQLMVDTDLESVRASPMFRDLLKQLTPIDPK